MAEPQSTGEDGPQTPNATPRQNADRARLLFVLFCVASAIAMTMFIFRAIQASRFSTLAFWFCGLAVAQLGITTFSNWHASRLRDATLAYQRVQTMTVLGPFQIALFIFIASMQLFSDVVDFLLVGAAIISMSGCLALLAINVRDTRSRLEVSGNHDESNNLVARPSEARVSRRTVIRSSVALGATGAMLGLWLALKPRVSFSDSGAMWTVAWSPDKRRLTSAGSTARVYVWDAATGTSRLIYKGHSTQHFHGVTSVAWSPDAQRIVSAGEDGTSQVWSATNGRTLLIYRGHFSSVTSVAWSPDGRFIVSGSGDHTARVWDSVTGTTALIYNLHLKTITSVAWSPQGDRIATASDDHTVHVWDARTGQQIYVYQGHNSGVSAVAWSPDGNRLVSGGDDLTAQTWDAHTGDHILTYTGHDGDVSGLAWSPDGQRIASSSSDGTAQVWDTRTGTQQAAYHGHLTWLAFTGVNAVTWSPDGQQVASAGDDVQIWQP